MKRLLMWGFVGAIGVAGARAADSTGSPQAEENFSKAVRPADFSSAGLTKLSPEELARLDALVRDYKSGALLAAKREAAAAEAARVAAEEKAAKAEVAKTEAEAKSRVAAQRAEVASAAAVASAAQAETAAKKSEPGLLAKAKVLLTPGTEVEFADTDGRIAGNFTGWEGKAIITLESGQRWLVVNGGSYNTPPLASPKVKITAAQFGGFWMTIEGVKQRVRVSPLNVGN